MESKVAHGEEVITEGEMLGQIATKRDNFYVVGRGEFEITK